jgi:hypothetical protein
VFCTARYQLGERLDDLSSDRLKLHTEEQRNQLLQNFGANIIDIPVRSKLKLFLAERLRPFAVLYISHCADNSLIIHLRLQYSAIATGTTQTPIRFRN